MRRLLAPLSSTPTVTAIAAALLVVVTTTGPVAQAPPPADPLVREGVTQRVGEHTFVIPDGNVGLVPNVVIVVGQRGVLVVDPGLGRRNGEAVLREVAKVGAGKPLFLASTHFHAEHTTGILAFPASAQYINAGIQEAEFAEAGAQLIETFSRRSPATAAILAGAVQRKADVTFERDYTLDLGGVHVRMVVAGPAHTRGDTAFLVDEDRVLVAGDVVMTNSFLAANASTSMRAWLAAFDVFDAMRPRVVVPSHGAVGDAASIAACRVVMQEIQARALALKLAGLSSEDVARTVQQEQQARHPGWPRVNGVAAAAASAYAEAR